MVALKLNGRPYQCPSCWAELTTRKYIRIVREWDQDKDFADRDYFKLFCILTDTNFVLQASTENEVTIWNAVSWVVEEDFRFSETPPKALQIGEKTILIPEDPGHLSIGANIHLRQAAASNGTMEESIAIACAIYLQPLYDEAEFDIEKARVLEGKILDLPVYLVKPLGFFLLRRALSYGKTPGNVLSRILRSLTRRFETMRRAWRDPNGLFHTTTWR